MSENDLRALHSVIKIKQLFSFLFLLFYGIYWIKCFIEKLICRWIIVTMYYLLQSSYTRYFGLLTLEDLQQIHLFHCCCWHFRWSSYTRSIYHTVFTETLLQPIDGFSNRQQSNFLSGLHSLYSEPHPLSSDPVGLGLFCRKSECFHRQEEPGSKSSW